MIVQPLEHVALIYHCHASQCVLINFWKAHTSLLTKEVATFLTMNIRVTSTLIQKISESLHDITLNRGHWFGVGGNWT